MEVTDIHIRRLDPTGKMKAVVSVTFDDEFVVHDIKVIESQNGLFIAMPSRKTPSGEYKDIVHPIHSAFREKLSALVLEHYQEALELRRIHEEFEASERNEHSGAIPHEEIDSGDRDIGHPPLQDSKT